MEFSGFTGATREAVEARRWQGVFAWAGFVGRISE